MTNPRDQVDDWLASEVTPLSPPPGSLDRIRHRARQRKTRQAVFAAAGCAVVLAAVATAPQLIAGGRQPGQQHRPVAVRPGSPAVRPTLGHRSLSSAPQSQKATQMQQRTTLSNSRTVPPPHFQPTSVTFVGNGQGGVVGAVIGQAGPPCATSDCTSLAGTKNYGQSWYGVSAPVAPGPPSIAGVSQLRFANLSDGWAYGPGLYETSHGGWPWTRENTAGQQVIDVEAVANRAFAVFGTCTGNGLSYPTGCTSFSLQTSVAGSTTWQPVSVPAAYQSMASPAPPLLVISGGTTGYLLTPSGAVLSGSTAGGAWQAVGQAPCKPGPADITSQAQNPGAQGSGSPGATVGSQSPGTTGGGAQNLGAQLAAGPDLLLACDSQGAGGRTRVTVYTSANGPSWRQAASLTVHGSVTSLAAAGKSAANSGTVLATTKGIEYSANGGRTWQAATFTSGGATGAGSRTGGPAGGFRYIGMTTATQGVAVPANASLGEIYVTTDGGSTWAAAPIAG